MNINHEPRQPFIRTSQWEPKTSDWDPARKRSRNYCSQPGCRRPVAYREGRWIHEEDSVGTA